MSEQSDRELVRLAQGGDSRACDALVQKYQHRILNLIGRYVADRMACHDVAQEAFLKAWRGLARFRGDSRFYTWLYRIAVNTAKNHLAAEFRRREQPLPAAAVDEELTVEDLQVDPDTPEQEHQARELGAAVNHALAELSEELRTAIALREIENLSYEEIAYVMECPVGTVRSRIFRARQALDEALRPLLD